LALPARSHHEEVVTAVELECVHWEEETLRSAASLLLFFNLR
jgi:hypothetical protein